MAPVDWPTRERLESLWNGQGQQLSFNRFAPDSVSQVQRTGADRRMRSRGVPEPAQRRSDPVPLLDRLRTESTRQGTAVRRGNDARALPGKASVLIADALTRHGSA